MGLMRDGIGAEVADLLANGTYAAFAIVKRERCDAAELIPEKHYRQVYLDVFKLKKRQQGMVNEVKMSCVLLHSPTGLNPYSGPPCGGCRLFVYEGLYLYTV